MKHLLYGILTTLTLTACQTTTPNPTPQPNRTGTHVIIDGTLTPHHYALTFQQNETPNNHITITRTTQPLHQHPLQPTDVLLIPQPTSEPPTQTIQTIRNHAQAGGHVILLANPTTNPNTDHINTIAEAFGITFEPNVITDPTNHHHTPHHPNTTNVTQHDTRVTTVTLMQPRSVTGGRAWLTTEPTSTRTNPHDTTTSHTTNQDNNQNGSTLEGTNPQTGQYTIGTTTTFGLGTITAIGDADLLTPWINHEAQTTYGLYANDNCQLILNVLTHTTPNANPTCQAPNHPDTHEPNDTPNDPTPTTLNQPQHTITANLTPNDTDWYTIQLDQPTHLSVTTHACVNNYCTYHPLQTTITDTHQTPRTQHTQANTTTTLAPQGTTLIRIQTTNPQHATPYTLIITTHPTGNGSIRGTAYGQANASERTTLTRVTEQDAPQTNQHHIQHLNLTPNAEIIPNQILIQRHDSSNHELITLPPNGLHAQNANAPTRIDHPDALATLQAIHTYRSDPSIRFAEPNYVMRTTNEPTSTNTGSNTNSDTNNDTKSVTNATNDPLATQQWHYDTIHLADAWEHAGTHPVTVAVIDTGYAPNRDLTCNQTPGYDILDRDRDPRDTGTWDTNRNHGTHVAGTIAACTNNREGVAGVAGTASIRTQHIRVLDHQGNGSMHDVLLGIMWAAGLDTTPHAIPTNPNPANIINLSLGCYGCQSTILEHAILQTTQRGIIIVAAAGNNARDAERHYPSAYPTVISVAATNRNDTLSDYSNHGHDIDILAPGGDTQHGILSTIGDHQYEPLIGTSMAAPHATGVIALLKTQNPNLTWLDAQDTLQRTSTPPQTCPSTRCPHGIINAHAALTTPTTERPNHWIATIDTTTIREHQTATITIWNAGAQTQTITAYHGRGQLTTTKNTLTLQPNQTGTITIQPTLQHQPPGTHTASIHLYSETQRHKIDLHLIKGHGETHEQAFILISTPERPHDPIMIIPTNHENDYAFEATQLPAGEYLMTGISGVTCHKFVEPRAVTVRAGETTTVKNVPIVAPCPN